jgi:tetratricopeptide (TPR) repeat protein
MNQAEFITIYNNLGNKCRQVLQQKLLGKTDQEITQILDIKSVATIRQHLSKAYESFQLSDDNKRGKWSDLQPLFFQFMPELIPLKPVETAALNARWIERPSDITKLQQWASQRFKILIIVGEGGIGKTTLAEQYLASCQFVKRLDMKIGLSPANLRSADSFVQTWLQQDFQEDAPRDFSLSLSLLEKKLHESKVAIFIDNLEPALRDGVFLPEYRNYVELLRVLSDTRILGVTIITSRERLNEPDIRGFQTHFLTGLTREAWEQYFHYPTTSKDLQALQEMHAFYKGHAQAMELLYNEIQNNYDGDISEAWQENRQQLQQLDPLLFLINHQLNRLYAHSQQAYRLLCRLGACRYQQIEWLPDTCIKALLWDVTPAEQLKVTRRLCDYSLLQLHRGKYRMHPAIRAAGLNQLQKSSEWEQTQRAIAQHWFSSVEHIQSPQLGLQVLEAYYHFREIEDYDSAWDVLCRPAIPILPEELFLYFLSWGYISQTLELAEKLVNRVSPNREASLYRCIGDCHAYLLADGFEVALEYHRQAQFAAKREGDKWTEFNSYSDMGLCYIAAGEYELGLAIYEAKLNLALSPISPAIQSRLNSCYCEVALLHSYLGQASEAKAALKEATRHLQQPLESVPPWQACWDLNMAGLAQKHIGEYEQAKQSLEQVVAIAQNCNFTSDIARAWYILGEVFRESNDFSASLKYQNQAIEFYTKIGAKYELGISNYYIGLTYRDLGELEIAQNHWQQAIQIFNRMKTPKQVNKVQDCLNV